jgi:hypothetical protein
MQNVVHLFRTPARQHRQDLSHRHRNSHATSTAADRGCTTSITHHTDSDMKYLVCRLLADSPAAVPVGSHDTREDAITQIEGATSDWLETAPLYSFRQTTGNSTHTITLHEPDGTLVETWALFEYKE